MDEVMGGQHSGPRRSPAACRHKAWLGAPGGLKVPTGNKAPRCGKCVGRGREQA